MTKKDQWRKPKYGKNGVGQNWLCRINTDPILIYILAFQNSFICILQSFIQKTAVFKSSLIEKTLKKPFFNQNSSSLFWPRKATNKIYQNFLNKSFVLFLAAYIFRLMRSISGKRYLRIDILRKFYIRTKIFDWFYKNISAALDIFLISKREMEKFKQMVYDNISCVH